MQHYGNEDKDYIDIDSRNVPRGYSQNTFLLVGKHDSLEA